MKAKFAATLCLIAFGLVHQGAAATFTVTTTANEGPGSLRDAILNANTGGVDRIEFRIPPLDDTVKTIVLTNALPVITDPVVIDGYTQGTASRNTLSTGNNARILIELTVPPASIALRSINGLTFAVGNNTVEGLSLHGFDNGIVLGTTNSNNRIFGNFIGLSPSGFFAGSLSNQQGIVIGGPNNRIGGPLPAERNIISGNFGNGILIVDLRATNNVIQGNFIGTDRHGVGAAPNGGGISLSAQHTRIGDWEPGTGNVISGNVRDGIIIGLGADYTIVQNNLIGTDVSGTIALRNDGQGVRVSSAFNQIGNPNPGLLGLPRGNLISANSAGVDISGSAASNNIIVANLIGTDITGTNAMGNRGNGINIFQANKNLIGNSHPAGGPGNVISGNFGSGIFIVAAAGFTISDNTIGAARDGVSDLGNGAHGIVGISRARDGFITGNVIGYNDLAGVAMDPTSTNNLIGSDWAPNAIFNNGLLGIDLGNLNPFDGVTPNDNCDVDTNVGNFGQNFPVITSVSNTPNGTEIEGFLSGPVDTEYLLSFFINDYCDPSGHGEGARWIASTSMAIGPDCRGTFTAIVPSPIPGCHFITANATDARNNTSEFSQCFAVGESGGCTAAPLGLTNWWPGEGITTNLAVGGASVGLSNGTAFVTGKVGSAFSFDGTDDFASVPDSPSLRPTSFTLEAWVNFRTVSATRRLLMGKPVGSTFNNSYMIFLQNGLFGAAIANASTVSTLATTFAPASNVWYHIAYTYNRADSNHAFYVNGVLQRRATANVTNSYDASPFLMGADRNNGTFQEFFAGLIDEPAIYDRALLAEELQDIFCAGSLGKCREPLAACSIVCPSDIVTNNAAGQCGATVNYPMPEVTGNCPAVVSTPPPGSFFPIGTNTVRCTTNGVVACTFKIIVNDTERPTITCPGDMIVNTSPGLCTRTVDFNPVVTDNCPGVTLLCNPPSGFAFPRGTTTVTCTATDVAGNTSTCEFDVTVNDMEPPTITCSTNISVEAPAGQAYANVNYPFATASDNCAGATVTCVPPSGSSFPIGSNTVTCTATDVAGNTTSCQFVVVVDPPSTSPRFSGIRVEGNDVRVSWQAQGGTTNQVQAAPTPAGTFTNLSPDIIIPGTGRFSTNFLDTGGAATGRSRFYRVRRLP